MSGPLYEQSKLPVSESGGRAVGSEHSFNDERVFAKIRLRAECA
jgi:hypothetical protein